VSRFFAALAGVYTAMAALPASVDVAHSLIIGGAVLCGLVAIIEAVEKGPKP
jgi:hypothetical protein